MPFSGMADGKPEKVSYYQYPVDKAMQPGTIWNPIITQNQKNGEVQKSFFQFTPNPVQPAGSIWNPLVTEKVKK
jgi:hypothetical protein